MSKSVVTLAFTLLLSGLAGATPITEWSGAQHDPHPCLYVTQADIAKAKKSRDDLPYLAAMKQFNADASIEPLILAALLTDNQVAQKLVVAEAIKALDGFLGKLPSTFENNRGPHTYSKPYFMAVGLADAALAVPSITAQERATILAKIAEACYQLNRPDYWGFKPWRVSYNPNMWTSAVAYRLAFAALIPSHPKAKEWFNKALAEHKGQLDSWIDQHGGQSECPHYAIVSFNQWLGSFVIAKNAGAANDGHLYDPALKRGALFLANISTPRDVKNGNFRRLPTLGHTYANERTNTFGLMARLWKDKDPGFAAEMAWMHLEYGSFAMPGILSYYPAFMGYQSFYSNPGITPKKPSLASQYYPEVGVQLRNVIGSDRETTLYMIAGRHHNHYFNDSGSITLWGKGAELCHEDDYQARRPVVSGKYEVGKYREVHSMPDNPSTFSVERVMDLREFSTAPDFDYTSGVRQGWTRQIAFVKDKDPLAPNYFVLADSFDEAAAPTIWRLYVAGNCKPIQNGVTVTASDKPDVEMDVIFLPPGKYRPQIKKGHIHVAVPKSGTLTAVLYPRLKSEPTPAVSMLSDGKGVQVKSSAGNDVVYLVPEAVRGQLGGKPFEGKAGLAKTRGGRTVVVAPGECNTIPGWEGGDPQTRALRWDGPQFPQYPDFDGELPEEGKVSDGESAGKGKVSDGSPVTGRFIRIQRVSADKKLSISEIQVFGPRVVPNAPRAVNFAREDGAGVHSVSNGSWQQAHLNDGSTGNFWESFRANPAFAIIDLGQDREIGSVRVHTRPGFEARLENFTVSVLADNGGSPGVVIAEQVYGKRPQAGLFGEVTFP